MSSKSKLTQQQQSTNEIQQQTEQQAAGKDFDSVEEMLRFDSSQNPVPDQIEDRLQESVDREGIKPSQSWWKRLLGK